MRVVRAEAPGPVAEDLLLLPEWESCVPDRPGEKAPLLPIVGRQIKIGTRTGPGTGGPEEPGGRGNRGAGGTAGGPQSTILEIGQNGAQVSGPLQKEVRTP